MSRQLRQFVSFIAAFIIAFEIVARFQPLVSPLSSWGDAQPAPILGSTGQGTAVGGPPPQRIQWDKVPLRHPVEKMMPIPWGRVSAIPQIQANFSESVDPIRRKLTRKRLDAVKKAFQHSWKGYRKYAWLHDEVRPISGGTNDPLGGWAATLVDSLDTLIIMGMEKEFRAALKAVEEIDFTFCNARTLNVFETTIRYLGGFLGAYDLSEQKHPVLLEKAVELGNVLYCSFDTKNRMPITRWDWEAGASGQDQGASSVTLLAEIGSLTLEFTRLSQLTGDPKYYDAVHRVSNYLARIQKDTQLPGLWPVSVDAANLNAKLNSVFSFGGMADSAYEYLPKQYLLLGGAKPQYRFMYENAMDAAKKFLLFEPLIPDREVGSESTIHPEKRQRPFMFGTARTESKADFPQLEPTGQHLTCFAGGMTALAARAFSDLSSKRSYLKDMDLARGLTETCYWAYENTKLGVAPEGWSALPCRIGQDAWTEGEEPDFSGQKGDCEWSRERWLTFLPSKYSTLPADTGSDQLEEFVLNNRLQPGFTEIGDRRYMLRPETIESLFVLYRTTADPIYQDQAWNMFEAIEKHTKTKISYAAIRDVTVDVTGSVGAKPELDDSTESFWTAETLKYFYLIFADPSTVSLDEYVFNTEAHPFRWRYPRVQGLLRKENL